MALNLINHLRNSTRITWLNTAGTEVLTLDENVTSGNGQQGAAHDFTTGSIESEYEWELVVRFNTTPVFGELVYVYWKSSADNVHYSNDDGTGDADVASIDKLRNLLLLGALEVDEETLDVDMRASGKFRLPARYGMPVIWNATADALHATDANNFFALTPIAPEIE